MPGVAAIHHPLRDVDAAAREISPVVDVDDFADRSAMNAHAQPEPARAFQRCRDFHRTSHGRFRAREKYQHHSVAGRQAKQFIGRFGAAELLGTADDLVQSLRKFRLLIDQQFRETDDVHEQHMADYQFSIAFQVSAHVPRG
ncbi:MAG TPA: hypothetical protein VF511_07530 [Chthoniobacterales bacterium]